MKALERSGRWNPGGGRWLDILSVVGIAAFSLQPIGEPRITLKSGFAWQRIYCTPGTLSYREQVEITDNGLTYNYSLKGFSPDDSAAKRTALEELLHRGPVLVRFCDNAGLVRLAGTPVQSFLFTYELATDTDVPGSRGYSLTLNGTTTQPAAYA